MSTAKPHSYADAAERARALVAEARLNDPGEHFPYKHDEVSALIAENPPAQHSPDEDDGDDRVFTDYISQDIADASRDMIAAQADYLRDPGDATKGAYDAAQLALVEARQAHRANRRGMSIGGRARRAGE